MRLFDVLGPVMIGPSSSHTAGASLPSRGEMAALDRGPLGVSSPHGNMEAQAKTLKSIA